MKQTLETLKSYFETGDKPTQAEYEDVLDSLVHEDDLKTILLENTVFVDTQNGDDSTAKISSIRKPFQTIDAAITAFETEKPRQGDATDVTHPFLNIQLISNGVYEINGRLPQRNIRFESKEVCTIDVSNNSNEYLNLVEANTHYKYIFSLPNGTLLNNSENQIFGDYLYFEGEFDVIETYGAPYSLLEKGFICAYQINVSYNLLKGSGTAFTTLSAYGINNFNGNVESVGAKLMVNNEGRGVNYFDFDEITGTHETLLQKAGLVYLTYVNFGKYKPNVAGIIIQIANTGKLFVDFKIDSEIKGSFSSGEIYLTGNNVTINASIARVQSKLIFDNISVKSTVTPTSLLLAPAEIIIKNSHFEIPSNLTTIETNTNFSNDVLTFIGHNSIFQTGSPGADLVTKTATANPTNVNYKVELQNSLVTNGVLNTTITGNSDSTATLTIGSTNTY